LETRTTENIKKTFGKGMPEVGVSKRNGINPFLLKTFSS
jgi:hypothetical protein